MKNLVTALVCLCTLVSFNSCEVNNSTSGFPVQMEQDSAEFVLAKKALQLVYDGNADSLKQLFIVDVVKEANAEQWHQVMTAWKSAMDGGSYPPDSLISVSKQYHKTVFKETNLKKFTFPFINEEQPKNSCYFEVSVSDNKLHGLTVTTGSKFIEKG